MDTNCRNSTNTDIYPKTHREYLSNVDLLSKRRRPNNRTQYLGKSDPVEYSLR